MPISFAEYKELPKKEVKKNKLEPGKKYYIQDTTRKLDKYKTVYKGIFIEKRGDSNIFSDVEFVVAPFGTIGKPFGFNAKSGNKFLEIIDFNPTELDFKNKNKTLEELHEFINEKKAEPHDTTPPISFMGEDYRKAKHTFYNKSSSKSRARSSSRSSTKKGGRKHPKRKTVKRRNK
jgi:hypothetical protein